MARAKNNDHLIDFMKDYPHISTNEVAVRLRLFQIGQRSAGYKDKRPCGRLHQ